MKKLFKKLSKLTLVAVLGVMMLVLTGCTAVQISASLALGEDGTGSRTITASIAKNDLQDGYGSAYYYLTAHGEELADYLSTAYSAAVPGSTDWLTVTVDDSGADWEVIDLTFDFNSFDDYKTKLAALAFDTTAAANYVAPEFTVNNDGTATYTENAAALTAIFKSIQTTMMADTAIFDIKSTKEGTALNDGSADFTSLTDFGVELMKPEFGNVMTVSIGEGEAATVEAADGVYTITGNYVAKEAIEPIEDVTEEVADDVTADETIDSEAPKTGESIALVVASVIGFVGCVVVFILTKKRKTQNQ
jgi:hypothetical protein